MGFFFEGYSLSTILGLLGIIAVLLLLNEVTRRSKWLSIFAYCILPIGVFALIYTGVFGSPSGKTWFGLVKTVSALAGVIGFMIIRYTKVGNTKFAGIFPMAILSLNILEAVFREIEVFTTYQTPMIDEAGGLFMQGGTWNILNAISGIIVIITLTGWMGIRVAKAKSKDMIWVDQLWFYVIAYGLWNLAYVYNCISNRAAYAGLALLIACTIAEFCFKRGAWLQHRAQTLSLFALFSISVDYSALPMFGLRSTNNTAALMTLSVVALTFCTGVLVYTVYKIIKTKRNPIKEDLYVDLKAYKRNLESNGL